MPQQPNDPLRALIEDSGLTYEQVARATGMVAAASGDPHVNPGRSSVAAWIAGRSPNPAAVRHLCEALTWKTGRTVTPEDIGLTAPRDSDLAALGLTVDSDPVETLGRLGRADIDRRRLLTRAAYSVAGAALPLGAAAEAQARTRYALDGHIAGDEEIQAVRDMVAMFTAMDERHGGQHGRSAVVQYLVTDVADLCRARFRTSRQYVEMLLAAASLVCLVGWKAFDAKEMGLAQRYYLQAYALTKEAGDAAHEAFTLRLLANHGMDNQRPQYVLNLADAALERAHGRVDAATESRFVICRARALTDTGQATAALREADLARDLAVTPVATAEMTGWSALWGPALSTVNTHRAMIAERLGDWAAAERHYHDVERRLSDVDYRVYAALTAASQARAQYRQGHLEAACTTWHRSLTTMTGTRSTRTTKAVHAMRATLAPVAARGSHTARELDDRARTWLHDTPSGR
ncbi:helix-turn-helix domain-containing protein [Streptomyces sp. NPDC057638]|uniref:helix-turn-helix domain-containing protein n=1 Tax=Streptomyces sp. NPDC057638 TaxID=3346190 RepID=UPI00369EED08